MKTLMGLALAAALLADTAQAEVTDKSAAGFEVVEKATIAAPTARVYAALLTPGAWWSKDHTWSHDAKNLSMDLKTGCYCEKLPHGFVRHMTIIYADGESTLRLSGGLGPMQMTGASGGLWFVLKDTAGKTELTATYDVGGYAKGGLADRFAEPLDHVLGEQVTRLKRYIETGKPD
jgi:hypothetical protein